MVQVEFYLLLLCAMMPSVRSGPPRPADVTGRFGFAGGPGSPLFSQCLANASVDDGLDTIEISEDISYVRFAPKLELEVDWTDLNLATPSIALCALEAADLGALMFKCQGKCSVALTSVYDLNGEQDSTDSPKEIVYVTTRQVNFIDGVPVTVGEYRGCYLSTSGGITFGDDEKRLVAETELPEPDACCPQADEGYCVVATCSDERISYCEAKARCEAKGYALASKSLYENRARIPQYKQLTDRGAYYFWIDAKLDDEGVWRWMQDGSEMKNITWSSTPQSGENCAVMDLLVQSFGKVRFSPVRCTNNFQPCALCYDPSSSLPACS